MASRLIHIKDWEAAAQAGNYSAAGLASWCGVSVRQLERYFRVSHSKSPRAWLREVRMRRAVTLLHAGTIVKETAFTLGYRDATHFTHDFKKYFGVSPSRFVLVIVATNESHVAFRQVMSPLDRPNGFQLPPAVVE